MFVAVSLLSLFAQSFEQLAFAQEKQHSLRIVSLSPATTEWVWALNLGSQLVGRTENCDFPQEATEVAPVGKFLEPNIEAILALKPDLILVTDDFNPRRVAELERLKLSVFRLNVGTLDALFASVKELANKIGGQKEASQIIKTIKSQLQKAQSSNAQRRSPVQSFVGFVDVSQKYVFSRNSFLGFLFSALNLKNIVETPSPFPQVTTEFLLEKAPDFVVLFDDLHVSTQLWPNNTPLRFFGPLALSAFEKQSLWESFGKNQSLRFLKLPGDLFLRPGPRLQAALTHLSLRLDSLRDTVVTSETRGKSAR